VPWVGIFNKKITTSAQNGYYIVLLFAEDMSFCSLSLNQGFTDFERKYPLRSALQEIKRTSQRALQHFNPDPKAILGPIDLKATGHLGRGYESGAIESYSYERHNLPTKKELEDDFCALLEHYDALFKAAGTTLYSLNPANEAQYQRRVLEKSHKKKTGAKHPYKELKGGMPLPPKNCSSISSAYQRDPEIAAYAIQLANFKCEIDPSHTTFISSARGIPYVEAHHLIPMGQQDRYPFSLDISANIVALCPNCHRLLHHGRVKDKKTQLAKLILARQEQLKEKEIFVEESELLTYYNKDLLEEEG
jgi:5-methylcytosine-specific restriction protein A